MYLELPKLNPWGHFPNYLLFSFHICQTSYFAIYVRTKDNELMYQFPLYMQDTIEGMMISQTPNSTHKAVNCTFSHCKVLPWGSALRAATV